MGSEAEEAMDTSPGWLPDPELPGQERYWDGSAWTDETRLHEQAEHPLVPGHVPDHAPDGRRHG
jgi:hypothetical protein